VLTVLQDQENQGNDEPTSAIRVKLFPTRGVHQPETMVEREAWFWRNYVDGMEAAGEICLGEWQDAAPAVFLRTLL
jgi:hypothetical protein